MAEFYAGQNNPSAATAELARLIVERPADAETLRDLARIYQQKGDLASARQFAERTFEINPRTASINDTLGWIMLAQGETDRALTYLSAANLSDAHDPGIQYRLAVALQRVGRLADARATLEPLLESGVAFTDRAEAEKLLEHVKHATP